MPLNDRQRVELGLPPFVLLNVVLAGAQVRHRPARERPADPVAKAEYVYRINSYRSFLRCKRHFSDAYMETVRDLGMAADMAKVLRRIERAHRMIVLPFVEAEARVEKFGLVAFYLLQILVTEGWVIVGEDSHLQRGLDLLLPGLEHVADIEGVNRSAMKQARKAYEKLKKEGYYR